MTKKTKKSRENSGQSDNDEGTRISQNEDEEINQEAAVEIQYPKERDSSSQLVKENNINSTLLNMNLMIAIIMLARMKMRLLSWRIEEEKDRQMEGKGKGIEFYFC